MEQHLPRGRRPKRQKARSVAQAYLALLADRGVDYLFGNAGTDFAPLVEAFAQAAQAGVSVPRPILAAHENLAVAMAHGYGMVSRRIPAVMVHVSVGTANMICAAMNAARENVAMLLTAGRSPLTETGLLGSRDGYIHWAQEMYDQAGMIREIVKWDYELRNAEQLATVVDRALAIAASEPRGPVYLSLPREVIAARISEMGPPLPSRLAAAAPPAADADAIAAAARVLADAKRPLIVTSNAGRDAAAFAALARFAERFAIPVVQHRPRYLSLPSSHPMNLGFDPARLVPMADAILVIESDVPWIPSRIGPRPDCKVVHCGLDPLFTRTPIRGFPCDVAVTGSTLAVLSSLASALEELADAQSLAARRRWVADERAALIAGWKTALDAAARKAPLDPAWVSHCIDRAKEPHAIVINEYTLFPEHCTFELPDLYFGSSAASGLGWGAAAALGAKLARPDRSVIAVVGDGAYMFSNPVAVHHAAALHDLPVLFVVMNNAMWGAVERSTLAMYPDGQASRSNAPPFVHLAKLPAFERICEAAGGYGERVDDPASLPPALERAMSVVSKEGRQALVNVICGPGGTA
jgi:acetolactate synthase I/II/III large subunit